MNCSLCTKFINSVALLWKAKRYYRWVTNLFTDATYRREASEMEMSFQPLLP
jgi:hypothetical protein